MISMNSMSHRHGDFCLMLTVLGECLFILSVLVTELCLPWITLHLDMFCFILSIHFWIFLMAIPVHFWVLSVGNTVFWAKFNIDKQLRCKHSSQFGYWNWVLIYFLMMLFYGNSVIMECWLLLKLWKLAV